MPVTSGFNHVATLTADMERTVKFYREAFDATVVFEMDAKGDHPRMSILDLGGGGGDNVGDVQVGAGQHCGVEEIVIGRWQSGRSQVQAHLPLLAFPAVHHRGSRTPEPTRTAPTSPVAIAMLLVGTKL